MTDVATETRSLHERLLKLVHVEKHGFVLMGKVLRELRKNNNYRNAVGEGINTWAEYLSQPEISLSIQEAGRLIQIYEELVLRLGYDEETIAAIPRKNANYLLPLVKKIDTRDEADELVADATMLSQRDFKLRVFDKKVEQSGGTLNPTYEYLIMRRTVETGALDRVPGIESEVIKAAFNLE